MYGYDSEPQFQGPDDQNSEISVNQNREFPPDEPISIPQPQPQPQPVIPPPALRDENRYHMDSRFPIGLFNKFEKNVIYITREDYYGNMIPLGSFCFAITFIVYGFYRCKVYRFNDTFLWTVIFLFGAIGQLTAGFLEYLKSRTFPASVYLCYGGYCLSHFFFYLIPKYLTFDKGDMVYPIHSASVCAYYSCWVCISFAITLSAVKINFLFVAQCLCTFVFFLLRAIGEGCGSLGTKKNAAGILQAIAGFFSLFVFMSQMINNEAFGEPKFPTIPLSDKNEVDRIRPQRTLN